MAYRLHVAPKFSHFSYKKVAKKNESESEKKTDKLYFFIFKFLNYFFIFKLSFYFFQINFFNFSR